MTDDPLSRGAPCVPSWWIREREKRVQVHEKVLTGSTFLGVPTERGFYAYGTGFFVAVDQDELTFLYLVSCRHVVESIRDAPGVHIRVDRKQKSPRTIPTPKSSWLFHPDKSVDVAVFPFDLRAWDVDDDLDIGLLRRETIFMTDEVSAKFGFSLGAEVFIVGAFVGRIGESRNIPIVRIGNVAAMPIEPVWPFSPRKPAYLVETRSLGGVSGSPVFYHVDPQRRPTGPWMHTLDHITEDAVLPYYLLGMLISGHSGRYSEDFASPDPDRILPTKDADFNAGISVVLPIDLIVEALDHPDLKRARDEAVAIKRQEVGAKRG